MEEKIDVINTISYFNTIGMEVKDICMANDFNFTNIVSEMGWRDDDCQNIKKISKANVIKICKILDKKELVDYLISFQNNYKISEKKALETYKENVKIYKKIKHIEKLLKDEFNYSIDKLGDISDFLGIEDEKLIFDEVQKNIALYKISNFVPDNLNLYAWLKRGKLDFDKLNLPLYDDKKFLEWIDSKSWLPYLTNVNYFLSLPSILSKFGVGLVFTPYLEKTVHGAVRWFDGRPLIQISDKGKCLATLWYTLFHEFGHVIKHKNDEIFEGNLDLSKSKINKKEQEANTFASQYLFNGDGFRKRIFLKRGQNVSSCFIDELTNQFNVDKIFIEYWLRKASIKVVNYNNKIHSINF